MAFNLLNNILNESLIVTKQISNACVISTTELRVKAKTPNMFVNNIMLFYMTYIIKNNLYY